MLILIISFEGKVYYKTSAGTSYVTYVKGQNQIALEMEGMRTIIKGNKAYIIMDEQRTYMETDAKSQKQAHHTFSDYQKDFELKKTGKTYTIAGYKCEEYFAKDKKTGYKSEVCFSKDIPLPLRTTFYIEGGRKETAEVYKIEKTTIDPKVFEVPKGYQKLDFNIPTR
ncbi:MAG: DUF4412 domain-containing protein [candidate division WOR-3 bacterium]|nr:DUF4412 domain-containing protein [candidate division WOR-3 bacterium]MCX7947248.1 DUF4412 domain-containing protein [candidate division WOR-3 bacterium]MDW8150195.1 DUF4412 domain-containing protein [candidate division WOR-3 bacterium]